jgi:hypothetical protein
MKRFSTVLISMLLIAILACGEGCAFQQRAAEVDDRLTTLEEKVEALEQQVEDLIETE